MNKKHDCNCGKSKCDGHCGISPAVLQINNPSECVYFRKVEVPASIGDDKTYPPYDGQYRNVLLVYNANGHVYMFSSDGIPIFISDGGKGIDDYNELKNKPSINEHELTGDSSLADIGVTDAINSALEGYSPTSDLAEVAFTGSYEDLTDTPTIPPVVQSLGTSTTSVMSQDAVTSSLFKNTSTLNSIAIGSTDDYNVTGSIQIGALTESPEDYCISIGYNARGSSGGYPYKAIAIGMDSGTAGESSIAIGSGAQAASDFSTAIGHNTDISLAEHSVALGDGSYVDYNTGDYVVSVGCDPGTSGRTAFTRRIANVTDPINAQDAATKTYVDTAASLVELSYGNSAWSDFISAYQRNMIVYCRASSNADPSTGAQGRKAFMAYVNNATTPTEVEFQYVRSVSSKTSSQPVDQVFVYKLTNANGGTWTVETRNMAPKLAAGTNASVSYSNGTYTISATVPTIVQTTGQSTTDVMSQKAVTDIIGDVETILNTLNVGAGV